MTKKNLTALAFALVGACTALSAHAQSQPSVSRQIFVGTDLNRDGYVDLDEFHKDVVNSFHALDHNRDGFITVDEIRSIPDKARVDLLLQTLKLADQDRDGRLSFKEAVERRMANFDAADSNKDDRLSLAEVVAFDAAAAQRFAAAWRPAPKPAK